MVFLSYLLQNFMRKNIYALSVHLGKIMKVLNTLNDTLAGAISKYWGIGLVGMSILGIGYYLGRKR